MATSTSTSPRAGPIGDIVALGQSVWFNNIRRGSQDHALTSCRSGLAGVARSNGVTGS